jgi:hypothetical protein
MLKTYTRHSRVGGNLGKMANNIGGISILYDESYLDSRLRGNDETEEFTIKSN